jgi:hypothetical protein
MLRADRMRPPEPAPCRQCDILVPGSETGRDISITDHMRYPHEGRTRDRQPWAVQWPEARRVDIGIFNMAV